MTGFSAARRTGYGRFAFDAWRSRFRQWRANRTRSDRGVGQQLQLNSHQQQRLTLLFDTLDDSREQLKVHTFEMRMALAELAAAPTTPGAIAAVFRAALQRADDHAAIVARDTATFVNSLQPEQRLRLQRLLRCQSV